MPQWETKTTDCKIIMNKKAFIDVRTTFSRYKG